MPINVRAKGDIVEFVGTGDLSADEVVIASARYHTSTPKKRGIVR